MSHRSSHVLVVGADGSVPSNAAVRWAARDAEMRNVGLTVVHVLPIGLPKSGLGLAIAPPPAKYLRRQEETDRHLIAEAVRVAEATHIESRPVQVHSEMRFTSLIPTLIDMSTEANMIVVGCRGHGPWGRALLGSVSTALIHHAHCPVAVIHDETSSPDPGAPVVVGVDGSPASELATAIAFDEASWRKADLVAIHAWSDFRWREAVVDWKDYRLLAEETLAQRLAGWCERYPDVTVRRVVTQDQPTRHLVEEAESAQLLVVGSHGRGGFDRMLIGSVSTAVVHAVHTPVIVARQR